ncbi:MAG: GNAT family N-acetyltransferase [Silicimonas sp.]|nr:GNAT family N-acetyltransferase [Silicimonas sp.]
MSQLLHLAGPGDFERLSSMVARYHQNEGIEMSDEQREQAVQPLLDGSPLGAVWFIGPKMAPVGYVAVSFGWSIEMGGMDAFIDELWVREKVRGRGMGSEALAALIPALEGAGIKALHLEVADGNPAERIYKRAGFKRRAFTLMTRVT